MQEEHSVAAELSQPQTWLASIVRNRCLDRLRRRDLDRVSLTRDDEAIESNMVSRVPQ